MSPSDISSWNFMKSISHLSHLGHGSPTRRIIDYSSHAGEIIRFFYWCQILDRQDLIKIGFQDIYFMFELRLRKGKKMRRRQGSGFENLLDHLFSFYSLLQVLKRKWEEDEEAALMNAKCLFPSNSLWWWILCPKDRYKFPYVLRKNESYNSKLYTSMKFGLVFSGHILSLQQTYYCVVCERLKRKNGKATSTVWRQPYSIKHVDPTFPIQYIEFWISRQPAHSTIEQRGKVIYFHCQSIVPFPTFEVK